MTTDALYAMLSDGLSAEDAAAVRRAIDREAVKTKTAGLKAQNEYADLEARATSLQLALDGGPDKPGAKAYQDWYDKNFAAVQKLQEDRAAYEKKFGALDAAPSPNNPNPQPAGGLTEAQVASLVDKQIQERYAARWGQLLTQTGGVVQKHLMAKRTTPVDFLALEKLAEKNGGNLELAYDEWDKPEREKQAASAQETEIKRRVDEELQKRGASQHFPAAADMTPSSMTARSKADLESFDKVGLKNKLAAEWAGQAS